MTRPGRRVTFQIGTAAAARSTVVPPNPQTTVAPVQHTPIVSVAAGQALTFTFPAAVARGDVVAIAYTRQIRNPASTGAFTATGLGAAWSNIEAGSVTIVGSTVGLFWGVAQTSGTQVTIQNALPNNLYALGLAYDLNGGTPTALGTAAGNGNPTAAAQTPPAHCQNGDLVLMAALAYGNNALAGAAPVTYTDTPAAWATLVPFVRLGDGYDGSYATYLLTAQRQAVTIELPQRTVTVTQTAAADDAYSAVAAIQLAATR